MQNVVTIDVATVTEQLTDPGTEAQSVSTRTNAEAAISNRKNRELALSCVHASTSNAVDSHHAFRVHRPATNASERDGRKTTALFPLQLAVA